MEMGVKKSTEMKRERDLQTNSRLFLAVSGVAFALTSGQAAFQLLGHALIAALTHWLQVNLHKLISGLVVVLTRTGGQRKGGSQRGIEAEEGKEVHTGVVKNSEVGRLEKTDSKGPENYILRKHGPIGSMGRDEQVKEYYMRGVTYLRVSFVLQVEQEKQLTHQALFRADTTETQETRGDKGRKSINISPNNTCI